MENISQVKLFIDSLDETIRQLHLDVEPIISKPLDELVASHTHSPVEAVSFYNNYLYTLISVLFAYLKTLGVDTSQHPIMKELTRIKSYMRRGKELEARVNRSEEDDKNNLQKAQQFLENTLGVSGGASAPDDLKKPAISESNFKGKHTKFEEPKEPETTKVPVKVPKEPKQQTNKGKVGKPKARKRKQKK